MLECEKYKVVSWYQRKCNKPAKYKVTKQHIYLGGSTLISTMLLCQYCARRDLQHRHKLDNRLYYNDSDLDHKYPIIERLTKN